MLLIETITVSERRDDPAPGPQRPAAEPTETEPPAAAPRPPARPPAAPVRPPDAVDRPGPTAPSDEVVARRARSPQRLDLRRDPELGGSGSAGAIPNCSASPGPSRWRRHGDRRAADGIGGAYAESRMVEDLRHHFGERPVKLVIITAGRSYQDLLQSWVGEVDAERGSTGRRCARCCRPPAARRRRPSSTPGDDASTDRTPTMTAVRYAVARRRHPPWGRWARRIRDRQRGPAGRLRAP